MKVRIIVDSTADMAPRYRGRAAVAPLTIHFGGEELIDGVSIDRRRFYERLVESDELPTTSQASPAVFQQLYEDAKRAGESTVVITISSKLSGTYQSACLAAADYENVYVVDSLSAAIGTASSPNTPSAAPRRVWTRCRSPHTLNKSARISA